MLCTLRLDLLLQPHEGKKVHHHGPHHVATFWSSAIEHEVREARASVDRGDNTTGVSDKIDQRFVHPSFGKS
jgi:hypothetical protein